MQSSKDHFKKIDQQAYLMAKAREDKAKSKDDDRWLPYSEIEGEEIGAENENEETEMLSW